MNSQEVQTGPLAAVKNDSAMDDPEQKLAVAVSFMLICLVAPVHSG